MVWTLPGRVRCVYPHRFRFQGLLAPRIQDGSRELGPSELLVVSTRIGFHGMALNDGVGPVAKLRGWVDFWVLRIGRLLSFWVRSLHHQHHAHDISCRHDVEQQRFTRFQGYHNQRRCEVPLELLECLFCLLCSDKRSRLP
jgi:hypothetical protein